VIRIIGDVHGKTAEYLKLIKVDHSIQLGDLGFNYSFLKRIDSSRHKILKGNHDNYDWDEPHFLGDGGAFELDGMPFFFIRGERSIDWKYRTQGIDYWAAEELNDEQMARIEEEYLKAKPVFVLSHGCPSDIIDQVALYKYFDNELLKPSKTAFFLQKLWDQWQPASWIFGHYHTNKTVIKWPTTFVCLNELQYIDISNGSIE